MELTWLITEIRISIMRGINYSRGEINGCENCGGKIFRCKIIGHLLYSYFIEMENTLR